MRGEKRNRIAIVFRSHNLIRQNTLTFVIMIIKQLFYKIIIKNII